MTTLPESDSETKAFIEEYARLEEIAKIKLKTETIDIKTEIKTEADEGNEAIEVTPAKRLKLEDPNENGERKSIIEICINHSEKKAKKEISETLKENATENSTENPSKENKQAEDINVTAATTVTTTNETSQSNDAADPSSTKLITQILKEIPTSEQTNLEKPELQKNDANECSVEATLKQSSDLTKSTTENGEQAPLDQSSGLTQHANETSEQQQSTLPAAEKETITLTELEQALDLKYRHSLEPFLQFVPCFKLELYVEERKVPRCRECLRRDGSAKITDVYCRFQEFRRMQYTSEGELIIAGFPNPYTDPLPEDINIWEPDDNTEPTAGYMDVQVCRYILLHVGDQFCYLWKQEFEALKLHENPDDTIAWKKPVADMREICDVCETTLFNYHWTCKNCGFGVCLDCFKERKECRLRQKLIGKSSKPKRGRDEFHWLLCTAAKEHKLAELMLTQIITDHSLNSLGRKLHEVRALWKIPQKCNCAYSRSSLSSGPEIETLNEIVDNMIIESRLNQHTALSSLATKETHKQQKRLEKFNRKKMEFTKKLDVDYNPGRVFTKERLDKDPITTAFDGYERINFLRQGLAGFRRFLPPKVMTLCQSILIAPNVRHEWLCDGKLLRLTDPLHPDNRLLFEEVWKCGQPVMVSEVAKSLDLSLWHPEAFCRDFGDKPNDLINCLTGNLVPNQPMRYFWEGFQCIKKRLLDASGKPMLLKLKDWPPGDDFAEILPTRYADLMNGLPLPEYTLRTGNLNIASCLPKLFVPPDLGPKMYNAYGSALHPNKGTTNLHLDISDAVNVMVYVGIPQDAESDSQLEAAQHAIAMGGCDFLTRARCQSPDVMPGAIWHIFAARDADKIRDLLNRVTIERGFRLEPDHDPIHDQSWYLDDSLRERLFLEYNVKAYSIVQCLGDAVFIPAGAPHQVQNLHNCIKVAEDFVSPENITHCYHLSHEFRQLSRSHTNHEDKLQIKNIIYHAVKDCCTILTRSLQRKMEAELKGN